MPHKGGAKISSRRERSEGLLQREREELLTSLLFLLHSHKQSHETIKQHVQVCFFPIFFFFLRATNILHVVYLGTELGFEVEEGKYKFLKRGQYNFSCTYFFKS